MSEIIQNIGTPAMIEAMEANFAEEMAAFGRGLPGAEIHEDSELVWFLTGRPHLNGVLLTHFTSDDKAYVDAKIDEMLAYFKVRHVTPGWSVGPSSRPANLATVLEAHGFTYGDKTIGMAVDMQAVHENTAMPPGLTIKEIEDRETLKMQSAISLRGFGSSEAHVQLYHDTYANVGFGKGTPWHHYIGYLNNEPVAISSLLLHAGVAGIYGVATIPEARRQGIGMAMTLYALHEARMLGYRVAILSPSDMSMEIYRRIGFQEYCKVQHYGWSSDKQ